MMRSAPENLEKLRSIFSPRATGLGVLLFMQLLLTQPAFLRVSGATPRTSSTLAGWLTGFHGDEGSYQTGSFPAVGFNTNDRTGDRGYLVDTMWPMLGQ
jgi:hypothetical protein